MYDLKKLFPGILRVDRRLPIQGMILRGLCAQHGQYVYEMAYKLGIPPSFLSQINRGKKDIPPYLISKIAEVYNLSTEQVKAIEEAVALSADEVRINIAGVPWQKRHMAVELAMRWNDITEYEAIEIASYLRSLDDENIREVH